MEANQLKPIFQILEKADNNHDNVNDKEYKNRWNKVVKDIVKQGNQTTKEELLISLSMISIFEFPNESKKKQLEKKLGVQIFIPSSLPIQTRQSTIPIFLHYLNSLNSMRSINNNNQEKNTMNEGIRSDGKSWISFTIEIYQKLEENGVLLVKPFTKNERVSLENYMRVLEPLSGSESTEYLARLAFSLIIMAYLEDIQFFTDRDEIFSILEDLNQCCQNLREPSKKETNKDTEESPVLVFIDMAVDIVSRQSDLLRYVTNSALNHFPGRITAESAEMLVDIIESKLQEEKDKGEKEEESDEEEDENGGEEQNDEDDEDDEETHEKGEDSNVVMEDEDGPLLTDEDMFEVDKEIIAALRAANKKSDDTNPTWRFLSDVASLLEIVVHKGLKNEGISMLCTILPSMMDITSQVDSKSNETKLLSSKLNSVLSHIVKFKSKIHEGVLNSEELSKIGELTTTTWRFAVKIQAKPTDNASQVLKFIYSILQKNGDYKSEHAQQILQSFRTNMDLVFTHKRKISPLTFKAIFEVAPNTGWQLFDALLEGAKNAHGTFERLLAIEFLLTLLNKKLDDHQTAILENNLSKCLNLIVALQKDALKRKKVPLIQTFLNVLKSRAPKHVDRIEELKHQLMEVKLSEEELEKVKLAKQKLLKNKKNDKLQGKTVKIDSKKQQKAEKLKRRNEKSLAKKEKRQTKKLKTQNK